MAHFVTLDLAQNMFLSLAMTFRVIIALLWASAHLLLADKTDCLSHADTMQRAAGSSLLSGH